MTDTIPPEALEAAARAAWNTDSPSQWERDKARAACLAMLKAWPGMHHYKPDAEPYYGRHIILPLPQEARDE